jgi:hypothetical protein
MQWPYLVMPVAFIINPVLAVFRGHVLSGENQKKREQGLQSLCSENK